MSVIWRRGSATASEILDEIEDDISYSTVMTMMRILQSKGHVRHEQDGKAFRFFAVTGAEEAGTTVLGRLLQKVFHGSRELLVNQLVSSEDISREEIQSIMKRLEQRLEEIEE